MNLRIVFKFKDCKLQFYEKRRLFCYFSVNPCMPASRWRRLLKLKRKKNSFKIIIGFFFTPPLFLATKVAISFVYCSPKTIKCAQKPKIEKSLQESTNRASERVPFSTSYLQLALAYARNSRVKKMRGLCRRRIRKLHIKFVILLTVNHTILIMLVQRIQCWIN